MNCNITSKLFKTFIETIFLLFIYCRDIGDIANANMAQLKIDRLSVARYPEKAKKILAKVKIFYFFLFLIFNKPKITHTHTTTDIINLFFFSILDQPVFQRYM